MVGGTLKVPERYWEGVDVDGDEVLGVKVTAQVVQWGYGNRTYLQVCHLFDRDLAAFIILTSTHINQHFFLFG